MKKRLNKMFNGIYKLKDKKNIYENMEIFDIILIKNILKNILN